MCSCIYPAVCVCMCVHHRVWGPVSYKMDRWIESICPQKLSMKWLFVQSDDTTLYIPFSWRCSQPKRLYFFRLTHGFPCIRVHASLNALLAGKFSTYKRSVCLVVDSGSVDSGRGLGTMPAQRKENTSLKSACVHSVSIIQYVHQHQCTSL